MMAPTLGGRDDRLRYARAHDRPRQPARQTASVAPVLSEPMARSTARGPLRARHRDPRSRARRRLRPPSDHRRRRHERLSHRAAARRLHPVRRVPQLRRQAPGGRGVPGDPSGHPRVRPGDVGARGATRARDRPADQRPRPVLGRPGRRPAPSLGGRADRGRDPVAADVRAEDGRRELPADRARPAAGRDPGGGRNVRRHGRGGDLASDPAACHPLPRRSPPGPDRCPTRGQARRRLEPAGVPLHHAAGDRAGRRRRLPPPGHPRAAGLRGAVRDVRGQPAEGLDAGRAGHLQHRDRGHQPRLRICDDDGPRRAHRPVPGGSLPRHPAAVRSDRRPRARRGPRCPAASTGSRRLGPVRARSGARRDATTRVVRRQTRSEGHRRRSGRGRVDPSRRLAGRTDRLDRDRQHAASRPPSPRCRRD